MAIPANGSATNSFRVTLKYADIINAVKDYTRKENLNCEVSGDIVLAVPKTGIPGIPPSYTFPYAVSKQIPAIKPEVSIKNFTITKPDKTEIMRSITSSASKLNYFDILKILDKLLAGNFNEAFKVIKPEDLDLKFDIAFDIELKNDTRSKIVFDHLNYEFFLNNDKMVAGNTTDIKTVANTTILRVKNTVSLKAFSKSIVKALEQKTGNFHLTGETAIKLPDAIKKEPLKLLFNEKGSLAVGVK